MQSTAVSYGSDPSGLVWGFPFGRDGAPAQALGSVAALDWMGDPARRGSGEFIWLHFNLSHAASEKWLKAHAALADEFYETLHQGSRSTRIELAENNLIAVVNDMQHVFSFEASDISTLWINVTQDVVISARRTPLQAIEHLRQAVRSGEAFRSSVELLTHLLRDQADVLVDIVRKAVTRVDQIEDTLLAGRMRYKREDLGSMRRVLVRLHWNLLPPQRGAGNDDEQHADENAAVEIILEDESGQHGGQHPFHIEQQRGRRGGRQGQPDHQQHRPGHTAGGDGAAQPGQVGRGQRHRPVARAAPGRAPDASLTQQT